jgi:hypothetical protein
LDDIFLVVQASAFNRMADKRLLVGSEVDFHMVRVGGVVDGCQ